MPVLEAGLVGIPVVSRAVPAAQELAEKEALIFSADDSAELVANYLLEIVERSPTAQLRRRIRMQFTWRAIFENEIQPILFSRTEN